MNMLVEQLTDALSLVAEAQRDALRGDTDGAMRQAASAACLLNEAVALVRG